MRILTSRHVAAVLGLVALGSLSLRAQHPSEFTARDKTGVFIQHVVKFMNLDPAKYQALVLRYEIATALTEVGSLEMGGLELNFIREALRELVPEYREALELFEAGKDAEALRLLDPLLHHTDPYLAANARLLRAEIAFRASEYASVIEHCEKLVGSERLRLIDDYRACELIALSFEKQGKPLLAFAQYAILTIDYEDLPEAVEKRAKARIAHLNEQVGKPLHRVAGWMNEVEKLLAREVTDEDPTQNKEREIVTALDKLIEFQEAVERNTCSSCGGGNCKGGQCRNTGNRKGKNPTSHARVSRLPGAGDGDLNLHGVSRANADSIWGQLRAKDASRALQAFSGKLPARYEKLLEQYYRQLAQER